jgi:hypothetical protein
MLSLEFDISTALAQPYPGLRPFEPQESFLFFGRQANTNELLRRLSRQRLLAVVGTSGSGKSSLVRAGLIPALYRGHLAGAGSSWCIAIMRPGSAPLDELTQALIAAELFSRKDKEIVRQTIGLSSMGLLNAIGQFGQQPLGSLLLVVDQFEELFRFNRAHQSGAESPLFVAALLEAIDQMELPVYVVLTMRSDFLGDCAQFVGLPEILNRSQYLVPRLTREERQEAIEGPLRLSGVRIAARLVQRLLNDAGEDPDQLPVMQHALMATFRKWKEQGANGELDLGHYLDAGGIVDAINRDAEGVYQTLDSADQLLAQRVFRCLTTSEGGRAIRRPARVERVLAVTGVSGDPAAEKQVTRIIERFATRENSFLVLTSGSQIKQESVVDISHESLIRKWKTLQRWVDEEAESVEWYKSLNRGSKLYETGAAGLWRDPDLKLALRRKTSDGWNQAWADQYSTGFERVTRFLEKSSSVQRGRRLRVASIVTLVLLVAAAGYWKDRQHRLNELELKLKLRSQFAATTKEEDEAKRKINELLIELSQLSDSNARSTLENDIARRQKSLQELQKETEKTKQQLGFHQNEPVSSQDSLLKAAYAQIDQLQADVNIAREQAQTSDAALKGAKDQISRLQAELNNALQQTQTPKRPFRQIVPTSSDITGIWFADEGGIYFIRQLGSRIWWSGQGGEPGRGLLNFSNVFAGERNGDQISGAWADVPQGQTSNGGTLQVKVTERYGGPILQKVNQTGNFSANVWQPQAIAP